MDKREWDVVWQAYGRCRRMWGCDVAPSWERFCDIFSDAVGEDAPYPDYYDFSHSGPSAAAALRDFRALKKARLSAPKESPP